MDQFLKRHNLPKFTQKEIDNLSWPISIKEAESIINNLLKQNLTDLGLLANSTKYLRKKYIYQFSTISERIFSNSF